MEAHERPTSVRTRSARSSRNSTEVHSILVSTGTSAAKPAPMEHVASPTSPSTSTRSGGSGGSSARHSFQSHGRTMSMAVDAAATTLGHGRTNRFSLSFPIQPAREMGAPSPTKQRHAASPSREAMSLGPENIASPTGPSDSNLLTAIAAQERRVLEIKEELQRAGKDLEALKKQWATQEAQKKRNDVRKVTKLQPLNTAGLSSCEDHKREDADHSSAWLQQEMDRRKLLLSGTKSSSRTVFSGSRHTRTLSLLSPVNARGPADFPTRQDSLPAKRKPAEHNKRQQQQQQQQRAQRPAIVARASTTPDLTTEVADHVDADGDLGAQAVDRETLIKGGKQMATHFKDGLWTFFEDLRQATIGDEATHHSQQQPPSRQGSIQSLRSGQLKHANSKTHLRPSSRTSTISTGSTETRKPRHHSPLQTRASPVQTPATEDPPNLLDTETNTYVNQAALSTLEATPARIKKPSSAPGKSPSKSSTHSNEGWDAWVESPQQPSPRPGHGSSESSATDESAHTLPSTTRTSLSMKRESVDRKSTDDGKEKEPLPWPALSKYGPAQLKRTASHLMQEWERTLTPSPGQEFTGQEDYLGLSAEAAASNVGSGQAPRKGGKGD